ncbi:hypothetical protein QFZ52_001647 [Arthrobacter woluwensis]|uniref:hypothetical protein n=1 Tax=Arthrobacter woluwensis TaxID=156980 RepID=UPI00278562FB|nr:hypothetical protein [Arthrobacter woluwensis]MDQ0708995.1 hypothetical protein [Arthrobacter woluwensis]
MKSRTGTIANIALAALCAVGLFVACLGLGSYLIRYAQLDGLEGTIPDPVYAQVTTMFGVEKLLLLAGLVLTLVGAISLLVTSALRRRAASGS